MCSDLNAAMLEDNFKVPTRNRADNQCKYFCSQEFSRQLGNIRDKFGTTSFNLPNHLENDNFYHKSFLSENYLNCQKFALVFELQSPEKWWWRSASARVSQLTLWLEFNLDSVQFSDENYSIFVTCKTIVVQFNSTKYHPFSSGSSGFFPRSNIGRMSGGS